MQRHLDLEREILLAVEADDHSEAWVNLSGVQGYDERQIGDHVMLLYEAELIDALERQNMNAVAGMGWHPKRLTMAGHEYLDTIRDPEIWRQTKDGAEQVGSFSLEFVSALAKGFIREQTKKLTGLEIDF